jgi:DNA-binding HxlR family transcriptional regulator
MPNFARSPCPIASTLDLVGDKWTLLLVRDMITGKKRFGEFLESPEGIPTNILSERLRRMEDARLIKRRLYLARPRRFEYLLTARGEGLWPVLQAISRFGNAHIAGTRVPPKHFMQSAE